MEWKEDVREGATKFPERQPIGTAAQGCCDKDYMEPPPAPLFERGELTSWSFYRAGIAEFVATFLFLYILVLTVMGVKQSSDKCSSVGPQGIAWATGGTIFVLVYCTAGISGFPTRLLFLLFLCANISPLGCLCFLDAKDLDIIFMQLEVAQGKMWMPDPCSAEESLRCVALPNGVVSG